MCKHIFLVKFLLMLFNILYIQFIKLWKKVLSLNSDKFSNFLCLVYYFIVLNYNVINFFLETIKDKYGNFKTYYHYPILVWLCF